MKGIKIAGGLVVVLLIILALNSSFIAKQNRKNHAMVVFISEQKAFTQEISKTIFYLYRNVHYPQDDTQLDVIVKKYLDNLSRSEGAFTQNEEIVSLWNTFYANVQRFRNQQRVPTGYNSLVTSKLVNQIYRTNLLLVNQFDRLLHAKQQSHASRMRGYYWLEYGLFVMLLGVLIYLFSRIHLVMEFIQEFRRTSRRIIENATIRGVKPIVIQSDDKLLSEVMQNHNQMVEQINQAIQQSRDAILNTSELLEQLSQRIESYMELITQMHSKKSTVQEAELFRREDAVIESLETLMRLRQRLTDLEQDLEQLMAHAPKGVL